MKQIIIGEGRSDTNRLKQVFPKIVTFETSGLGIDEEKILMLKKLAIDNELIVFTDPDRAGEQIRMTLKLNIENLKHAFLPNDKAISKNMQSVGVEHASDNDIKIALECLYEYQNVEQKYKVADLIEWGIYNSKIRRKLFCDGLHIAFGNNKKVVEQLNYFAIEIKKINQVLEEVNNASIENIN